MESLRVHNGGCSPFPNSKQQRSCFPSFSKLQQVNNKYNFFFVDPKSQQLQMTQVKRPTAIVNSCVNCSRRSSSLSPSTFDHLIHSDPTWRDLTSSSIHPKKRDEEGDISEKLHQWVRDSVIEIVNNIQEAPFLVYIYSDGDGSSSSIRLAREKAVAESWPLIRGRWESGSPAPNGVILVEELKSKEEVDDETKLNCNSSSSSSGSGETESQVHSTTKVWGILIQGKGINRTACYILKTCQVGSSLGFCTHFCLVMVDCFLENADTQLKKLWLQR